MVKNMTFIKRLFGMLLCTAVVLTTVGTVRSEAVYNGDFLKRKYTLFAAEQITSQNADAFRHIADDALPGRSEISFVFNAKTSLSEARLNFVAQKLSADDSVSVLSIVAEMEDGYFSVSGIGSDGSGSMISDKLEAGRDYSITVQLDLNSDVYNVILYEGKSKNHLIHYKRGIGIGARHNVYGFKGVDFSQASAVEVTNFFAFRERLSDDVPVIDTENKIVTVGANISDNIKLGDAYDVYAAFYSPDRSSLCAVEKKERIFRGYDNYCEVVFPLNDNFKSTASLSVYVFKKNDIAPLSKSLSVNISSDGLLYDNALAYTGFEASEKYNSSTAVTGGRLPDGWYAQGWEGASSPCKIEMLSNADGESFIALGAVDKGYMGIRCGGVPLCENGIRVSFKVKISEDYIGNYPRIVVLYFDAGGSFVGSSYRVYEEAVSHSWKKGYVYIKPEDYPVGAARASVAFCTANSAVDYGGSLYYDSLCVDNLLFDMECDEELSWYTLGETAVYRPKYALCDEISEVCGSVYNSDGVLVEEVSFDSESTAKNGWQYKPEKSGFYKVIFHARTRDNRTIFEQASYKAYYDDNTGKLYYIDRASHDFYVTNFENKEMNSRNKLYGMSIDNYDGDYDLNIADKLGMSFVRLHAFSWKDIESENVTKDNGKQYNWENYDKIFNSVRNSKLNFDVIGNILYTPKWASPSDDESGMKPRYSSYAPTDMTYLTDFIKDLYERYGDAVNTWEIYNEPHLPSGGGSVFWHDTPENYVKMLSSAYTELKALSGGKDTVFMGGIGAKRYLSFYREFLRKGGWQYTDKLAMHGYDLDPWNYLELNSKLGSDADKGVVNTEAHMLLFNQASANIYYTEKQLALRMLLEYFRQIKYGVEQIAYFQPYDNSVQAEDLMILDNISDERDVVTAGIFRKKPYYQPRFAAGVLNTLISLSGESIRYIDEYKSANVNIVKFDVSGKPLYVLWGDNLGAMTSDADIGEFDGSTCIFDWEGRRVASDKFTVGADEVYFVTGLDENVFSHLASAGGDNVYSGEVLYSENEMNKKSVNGQPLIASKVKLFEHGTHTLNSEDIVWNDISHISGNDFEGKLALSVCDDGVDLSVRVKDNGALRRALLTVGVDTFSNGIQMDVVEISAAVNENGSTVTKTAAPDIGGDMPFDDYSAEGESVKGAEVFVTKNGEYSYYCMHVPFAQLYPYFHSEDGSMNLGLKFIGYNAYGNELSRCYTGKDYSRYKPWEFGMVNFNVSDNLSRAVDIEVPAEVGEYVTVTILNNNELVYFNQYIADNDGKCRIKASLPHGGDYTLKTYTDSRGYETYELSYPTK